MRKWLFRHQWFCWSSLENSSLMEKWLGRLSTEGVSEVLRDQALLRKDEHPIVTQTEYILEIKVLILQRAEAAISLDWNRWEWFSDHCLYFIHRINYKPNCSQIYNIRGVFYFHLFNVITIMPMVTFVLNFQLLNLIFSRLNLAIKCSLCQSIKGKSSGNSIFSIIVFWNAFGCNKHKHTW